MAGARQVLGDVEVFATDRYYELDHERTGIQLLCNTADGMGISAPYGYGDVDADAVTELMYLLGRVVEEATGLEGYDPQLDLPLSDAFERADLRVGLFTSVAAMFARAERTAARLRERRRTKRRQSRSDG